MKNKKLKIKSWFAFAFDKDSGEVKLSESALTREGLDNFVSLWQDKYTIGIFNGGEWL